MLDFAVNVSAPQPPPWLTAVLQDALAGVARYPDARPAQAALARLHGIPTDRVLLVAGAAEAFTLVAGLAWREPVVVHPQFTEPEAALRAHGHRVRRVLLSAAQAFALPPAGGVPAGADLVVVGNPTNPTSRLHPAAGLLAMTRPGRLLLVDEAFMDAVEGPSQPVHSLVPYAARTEGLAVVRSLTKTFAIAGLRVGYVVGAPGLLATLSRRQPHWAVGSVACAAAVACAGPDGRRHAEALRRDLPGRLAALTAGLRSSGLDVVDAARGPFVLARHPAARSLRETLRAGGIAVRRGDSFPGLGEQWLRFAARPPADVDRLVAALRATSDTALQRIR